MRSTRPPTPTSARRSPHPDPPTPVGDIVRCGNHAAPHVSVGASPPCYRRAHEGTAGGNRVDADRARGLLGFTQQRAEHPGPPAERHRPRAAALGQGHGGHEQEDPVVAA
ncbi:protein of unknown function [Micropruina glycogenica]|uniref:Uncharacterized protein n=1 Tax=Micropruina glycogenica TaxID=75385 RepID=A0A2N9JL73_9ACTN|nr:protein of unknown function [Micropruina glycogenica]